MWSIRWNLDSAGVLALDLRGHGESGGAYGSLQSMLLDVQAALAWLKTRHEVNTSRIGIEDELQVNFTPGAFDGCALIDRTSR